MATPEPVVSETKLYDVRRYGLDDFDAHFCLRPPLLLLAVLLFLGRGFLVPIAEAATRMGGAAGGSAALLEHQLPFWYLLQMPVLLVAYAWLRRTPNADPVARAAWGYGRWLLLGSTVMQAAVIVFSLPAGWADVESGSLQSMLMLFALLAVAVCILRSQRMTNAFCDFPAASR